MTERKIRAGYYRRYDGKVVYVASLATDVDTGKCHLDHLPLCNCPQILHLQQKVLLRFYRSERRTES